jgi:NTE family protein
MSRLALALLPILLFTGCPHWPENEPLSRPLRPSQGYRFENLSLGIANTNSVVVCLSLSGGGTRAGAMAYGVLKTLIETPIAAGTRTLADEIDIISASSGGAFAAAYYGAFGPQAFLREFPERVLEQDLGMGSFWRAALCPYNLIRICSPWFNRSDLAAELYADEIYGPYTYAHLSFRGRPFVVLNATDLQAGTRFEFTQDQFDGLGSSLGCISLARAVAASAAFPFLLTPVAFRDHTEAESYRHLVDGGVVDNMGLGYLLDSSERGALHDLIQTGEVETLVFVVVNARNRASEEMTVSPQAPGAASVLSYGLSAAIDRRDEDQVRRLAQLCQREQLPDGGASPRVYFIQIALEDVADPRLRERLLAVETTFGLEPEVVGELVDAAARLTRLHPEFVRLQTDLR